MYYDENEASSPQLAARFSPHPVNKYPAAWAAPHLITVTGIDDNDPAPWDDGHQTYTLQFGPTVSADPLFNGLSHDGVAVKNLDDDCLANPDEVTTPEEEPIDIFILDNDQDLDGDQSFAEISHTDPAHGELTGGGFYFTYTPDVDFNGTDSFQYTITNEYGKTSTATVTIMVGKKNDQPEGNQLEIITDEDTLEEFTLTGDDKDPMPDEQQVLTYEIIDWPSFGSLDIDPETGVGAYMPYANYNGDDSFTYVVIDDATAGGPALVSEVITVPIVVNPINDMPRANSTSSVIDEDGEAWVYVEADGGEYEEGQSLTQYVVTTAPAHGSAAWSELIGAFVYVPEENYNGGDSFQYIVIDDDSEGPDYFFLESDPATISISVTLVNDAPVAVDDTETTDEDVAVTINVLGNDFDIDSPTITVIGAGGWSLDGQPANGGTVTFSGTSITYTPYEDWYGVEDLWYVVSDGEFEVYGYVTVTVAPVNDAPIVDENWLGPVDSSNPTSSQTLLATDVDLDEWFIVSVGTAAAGTI